MTTYDILEISPRVISMLTDSESERDKLFELSTQSSFMDEVEKLQGSGYYADRRLEDSVKRALLHQLWRIRSHAPSQL